MSTTPIRLMQSEADSRETADASAPEHETPASVVDLKNFEERLRTAILSAQNPIRTPSLRDIFNEVSRAAKERSTSGSH